MNPQASTHAWTRFATWTVGSAIVLFVGLVAALYLIDPYDTGRSPFTRQPRLKEQKAGYATASVGRNPHYTGAIIGNSTIALVKPARLTALTGIPFAQLSVPGVQVREQLTLIDWFARHHTDTAKALVISVNRDTWCTHDPSFPTDNPFPYWRYSADHLEYLVGLISATSVEQAFRRVVGSRSTKTATSDGYWDYEPMYAPLINNLPRRREVLYRRLSDNASSSTVFPAADALEQKLATVSANMPVVLVFPPVFSAKQPKPGTARESAERACRQRYLDLAARRPGTAVVDWWADRPQLGDVEQFIDQIHYRHPIARVLEDDIARALKDVQRKTSLAE